MAHEGDLPLHTEQKVSPVSTYLNCLDFQCGKIRLTKTAKNIVWSCHTIPDCHNHL